MMEGRPGGSAPCTPAKDKSLEPVHLVGRTGGGLRVRSHIRVAPPLFSQPIEWGLGTSPQRGVQGGRAPLAFFP